MMPFRERATLARAPFADVSPSSLSRRFSLNLQDSQFTVLALVPTVASQLQQELDVEARSKALSDLARREKERRTDEVRRAQEADAAAAAAQEQEKQKEERRKAEEAQKALDAPGQDAGEAGPGAAAQESAAAHGEELAIGGPADAAGETQPNGVDVSSDASEPAAPQAATPPSTGAPPSTSLNPAAPVFQPRSASPPVESSDAAPPAVIAESDGSSSVLGKSWAEIVKTAPPAPEAPIVEPETSTPSVETNGAKVGSAPAAVAEGQANVEANGAANGEANGGADGASAEPAVKTPMAPQEPEKSKAELWNEIKLLCASPPLLLLVHR